MYLERIETVPDHVFDNARFATTTADREGLLVRSTYLAAIKEGRELMFVLGVLPPTKLSDIAYLWMVVPKGVQFTRGIAREFARHRDEFFAKFPYAFRAEAMDDVAGRWLTFLGAKPLAQLGDRTLYGWDN